MDNGETEIQSPVLSRRKRRFLLISHENYVDILGKASIMVVAEWSIKKSWEKEKMNILLSLSVAILAGLLMTRVFKPLRLPSVTAYLVAGILVGPYCLGRLGLDGLGFVTMDAVSKLSIISDVALGFIAFSIGNEFRLSSLRKTGRQATVIGIVQAVAATLLVDIVLIVFSILFPGLISIDQAIVLGAIAAATAPAATLMVVRQYKANGPVTRMLLPVVAMDDALGLMLYAIMMAIARTLDSGAALSVMTLLVKPLIEIVGSLVMGVLIGTVMVFCLRFFHSRGNKLTMTILIVFLAVGLSTMLDLSSLLVCMMIGATMINVSNDSPALLEQCDRFTPPLFLLFFVLSGASLDLSVLPTVGVVGIAYVLSRAIGKSLGATIGAAIEKCDKNIIRYLGMTLIPQAGVAIGMARMCLTDLPAYGPTINAVVLAGTLIYELTGPVITKIALTKAGEIKEGGAKPAAVTAAK